MTKPFELVVASGKGGAGKTSVAAALGALANAPVVLADADVDAANLALLVSGRDRQRQPFVAGLRARIDSLLCSGCGACAEACPYDAIRQTPEGEWQVRTVACEGCKVCTLVCPEAAIEMTDNLAGHYWLRDTANGGLVHAELGIAQDNSGKLVAKVREEARDLAEALEARLIIIDGPPGIGCPVHAAISGVHQLLVVVEPTLSGLHDAARLLDVAVHFKVPAALALNKGGIGERKRVTDLAARYQADLLGEIPYDPAVPRALARGETLLAASPAVREAVVALWQRLQEHISRRTPATP